MTPPSSMITARSTTFSSSRTFPGHDQASRARQASGENSAICRRWRTANRFRKASAMRRTSPSRSRRGGRRTGKTESR